MINLPEKSLIESFSLDFSSFEMKILVYLNTRGEGRDRERVVKYKLVISP